MNFSGRSDNSLTTMSRLPSSIAAAIWRKPRSVRRRIIKLCGRFGVARFSTPIRLTPVDRDFGFKRGKPIDRHYIERFLGLHSDAISGRVLEIGDDTYTRRFGGDRVALRDVLHVKEGNARATIVGDLAVGEGIPSNAFDCVILCQTLHLIYDFRAALGTLHQSLKPGGVALVTVPGISQVATWHEWGRTWYWAFTVLALQRALDEVFSGGQVHVESHGNVLSACAFLYGLATEELAHRELDFCDPDFPVIVAARAVKGGPNHEVGGAGSRSRMGARPAAPAVAARANPSLSPRRRDRDRSVASVRDPGALWSRPAHTQSS